MRNVIYAACIALSACSDSGKKPPEPVAQVTAVVEVPTIDEAMTATQRGHPHAIRICYDEKLNGYFLEYSPYPTRSKEEDNFFHGWWFLQKVEYHKAANNTWFITDQPMTNYSQVYPDVAGLPCKSQ